MIVFSNHSRVYIVRCYSLFIPLYSYDYDGLIRKNYAWEVEVQPVRIVLVVPFLCPCRVTEFRQMEASSLLLESMSLYLSTRQRLNLGENQFSKRVLVIVAARYKAPKFKRQVQDFNSAFQAPILMSLTILHQCNTRSFQHHLISQEH